jgi:hypothetical protein
MAIRRHGARSLWHELTSRYQRISATLLDKVPDIQYNFSDNKQAKLPTKADLSEEFILVE